MNPSVQDELIIFCLIRGNKLVTPERLELSAR